ncbi:MAG: hypothetical protein FJ104_11210, partial [Deltaproteobacteria bacterium]|nr:hypothetical protein [Deltaproteobacteria bacterium]
RVARGYRISWEFPGDVGQPTEISLRAPPGFRVGPARFPAPERVELPGGLVAYAYRGDTAVFFEVTPPRSMGADDVHRLDMSGAWVACKRSCVAERTQAFLELMTTTVDAPAEEARAELAPLLARVPDEQPGALELRWEVDGVEATLVATTPGARPRDFFPDGKATPPPLGVTFGEDALRFRFAEAPRPGSRPLRGVVVVSGPGGERALRLVAPLPGEDAPGTVAPDPRGRATPR